MGSDYHPVPVPFNIVSIPAAGIYGLLKKRDNAAIKHSNENRKVSWIMCFSSYFSASNT